MFVFFFSSRRRHTRWNCDWSSDVCSSDLEQPLLLQLLADALLHPRLETEELDKLRRRQIELIKAAKDSDPLELIGIYGRSEERRVGKECRSRGARAQ